MSVVGSTGAGKSSVLNLLVRFWDWDEGEILVDGRSLREIEPVRARSLIAVSPQHPYLFHSTIRENLLLARPDATNAEIAAASRAACIHDAITALPDGYDTPVGEHGRALSAGEPRRLSIARALLAGAPVLALDEPTEGLDASTARALMAGVFEEAAGRTIIVITHRLRLLSGEEKVVVLEKGRVVEQGRHEELLVRGRVYPQLWDLEA